MAPPERSHKNSHHSRGGPHAGPSNNDSNNNSDQQQQVNKPNTFINCFLILTKIAFFEN